MFYAAGCQDIILVWLAGAEETRLGLSYQAFVHQNHIIINTFPYGIEGRGSRNVWSNLVRTTQ
jgi:hypothetical protein